MASSSHGLPMPTSDAKEDITEPPNWLELPRDVTAKILHKLGAVEILNSAQLVCTLWRDICKDPLMWRSIEMRSSGHTDFYDSDDAHDLEIMWRHAIDRSCGQLLDITLVRCGTNHLLKYIADSACDLRCIRLVSCSLISNEGFIEVVKNFPLLEELHISGCYLSQNSLEAIGQCCPLLKSLKFNKRPYRYHVYDGEAFAIAETMPQLVNLQLFGNSLTNAGLLAILDGCPLLQSLDLRACFNVDLEGSLEKRCAEQIKGLHRPDEYPAELFRDDDDDDDYRVGDGGFSDDFDD